MLIASMSNSYSEITEKGDLFWKKLRSQNIRMMERKMPLCVQCLISNEKHMTTFPTRTKKVLDKSSNTDSKNDYEIKKESRKISWYKLQLK